MDNRKTNQLADDIHLVTAPVRIVGDWIKILVFIAVLPIVFVVSVVNWLVTGKPIMSPDEIWLTKVLLTILSPLITTIFYVFHKHWRRMKDNGISAFNSCSSGVCHCPCSYSPKDTWSQKRNTR